MFFSEKIKSIKTVYKVLEIGPGGTPYFRSDVFLELNIKGENVKKSQRGEAFPLVTNKKIVYYDGNFFPFKDKEFDYVVCSHVLEHVPNVEMFLSEVFRVSKHGGYFEFPTIYYEHLLNLDVHLNLLRFDEKTNRLWFIKKSKLGIFDCSNANELWRSSMKYGYLTDLIDDLKSYLFQGFEWSEKFKFSETEDIKKVCVRDLNLPIFVEYKKHISRLLKTIKNFWIK